jgi:hypothetical protein
MLDFDTIADAEVWEEPVHANRRAGIMPALSIFVYQIIAPLRAGHAYGECRNFRA